MNERVVQRVVAALAAGAVVVGLGLLGVVLNVVGPTTVQRWVPGFQVDITCGYGDVATLPPFTVPCPTVTVERFEDGSGVLSDGTTFCDVDAVCDRDGR